MKYAFRLCVGNFSNTLKSGLGWKMFPLRFTVLRFSDSLEFVDLDFAVESEGQNEEPLAVDIAL